ncbi:MAG: cation-translocating P-type ATPase [Xanthomonadales bacterium]|nr:cation-translocating P-type ATPase [Xanthomonadales bacterium]
MNAPGAHPGLSAAEAALRLRRDGPNLLPQPERRGWSRMLFDVVREPMLLLLVAAAVLYLLLGEARDAAILGASVLLVIALTLYQELRSEHALQALRDLSSPRARVLRDGVERNLAARELVVGDMISVAEGDRVPADARIVDDAELELDESLLTGESMPVRRFAGTGAGIDAGTDDAQSTIQAGTLVVRGHGLAEVTAIGARTGMGRIGASLQTLPTERTPLQNEMRRVVVLFALIGMASCVLMIVLYGWLRGDWLQALLAGITLAMSNIPEEFPVVLTVFLALGGWRMAHQRVLVRRPPAIEALGAVTVLCTDKTGTLTENRMALQEIAIERNPAMVVDAVHGEAGRALLRCARLASARETHDPMDRAILDAVADDPASAENLHRYPLSSALPVYANVWRIDDDPSLVVACKGAPETLAILCGLAPEALAETMTQAGAMAQRGLRVIAVAQAKWPQDAALPDDVRGFRFQWRGLLAFADPLRAAVPAAVAEARAAGVRVVMLTGDHPDTARNIAAQAGLSGRPRVALGADLAALDDAGFAAAANDIDVFARVQPEHKLRLVEALKANGAVVAMTGDGVNDAPALMTAHVGVAMGARGTDVAREASSIVLLDDDFASIVRAIRMGRTIYDNIGRAARYIIAVHIPITGLALLPLLLDAPLILLPLHIVFLEMIVDPACSFVFEREPPAENIMRRPPRAPDARLIDAATFAASIGRGLLAFVAVLAVYLLAGRAGLATTQQAALAFTALVIGNLGLIVLHRSGDSLWRALRRPNPAFAIVSALTLALLAAITLLPGASAWFGFAPPPLPWLLLAAATPPMLLFAVDLVERRWAERRHGNSTTT